MRVVRCLTVNFLHSRICIPRVAVLLMTDRATVSKHAGSQGGFGR